MIVVGMPVLAPLAAAGAARRHADILLPETVLDLLPGGQLGAPMATADGDLAGATPSAALRSRVIRMVANVEDAYAHLVGWGLAPRRGQLARPTDLERIRLQSERRLVEDPDVLEARVTITRAPNGVRRAFLYRVQVRDRLGRVDDFLTSGEE